MNPNGDYLEVTVQGLSAAVDRLSDKQDRSIGDLVSDSKVRIIVSFGGFCRRVHIIVIEFLMMGNYPAR